MKFSENNASSSFARAVSKMSFPIKNRANFP